MMGWFIFPDSGEVGQSMNIFRKQVDHVYIPIFFSITKRFSELEHTLNLEYYSASNKTMSDRPSEKNSEAFRGIIRHHLGSTFFGNLESFHLLNMGHRQFLVDELKNFHNNMFVDSCIEFVKSWSIMILVDDFSSSSHHEIKYECGLMKISFLFVQLVIAKILNFSEMKKLWEEYDKEKSWTITIYSSRLKYLSAVPETSINYVYLLHFWIPHTILGRFCVIFYTEN